MNCQKLNRTTLTHYRLNATSSMLTDSTMEILSVTTEECSCPSTKAEGKVKLFPRLRFSRGSQCIQSLCIKLFNAVSNNITSTSQLAYQNNAMLHLHFGESQAIKLFLLPYLFIFSAFVTVWGW